MTREYMENMIILFTGWDKDVFKSMSDDKITEVYRERVEKTMDVSG